MLDVVAVVVGIAATGGMAAAGVQAVHLGQEIARDRMSVTAAALQRAYGAIVNEGVPDDMLRLLDNLGDAGNGTPS